MRAIIVYHSDYGSTEKLAQAIAAGMTASDANIEVHLKRADQCTPEQLLDAEILVFGTPVHMGAMSWQLKRLIDDSASLWMEGALAGKLGGAFVTAGGFGGAGGGGEQTLISLHANFLEHGMLVAGFPKSLPGYRDAGLHWGVCARTGDAQGMPAGIQEGALMAGRSYGAHLAEVAQRLFKGCD
ncbi:MAG: Trp repressor-binding protein [Zetaproteobacteria bacterium]|nr:MAG: Trp repressor-binding protein [Zetaproteobacteria bacterium]